MPQTINLPEQDYAPGAYNAEVTAPARMSGAVVTLTRPGAGWPAGELFTWRVYEQQRGGALALLASATEFGGTITGKGGAINPSLQVGLKWPDDADKDRIRFEIDVVQTFRTAISLEFVA